MCNRECEKSPTTIAIGPYLADLARSIKRARAGECANLDQTSRSRNSVLILKEHNR
jgi:hypothetical protein